MADAANKGSWRCRLYDRSRRMFDLTVSAARAAFVGMWLGLLDRDTLHEADALYYRRVRMYHDERYNLSGLFGWEVNAVDQHFSSCRSLLVASAGGGREVVGLERRGLEVFAFECNPELVQAGNELLSREGLKTRIAPAARDECPTPLPKCDGAIVGWSGYMLIQHRTRRIRFLRQLRAQLPAGGPLLLSFFVRSADSRNQRLTAAIANVLRRLRGRERIEIGDDLTPNFVHRFLEAEIAAELEAGGFRLVEFSTAGYGHTIAQAVDALDAPQVPASTIGPSPAAAKA
jgi:SAM-dependent methyltransferase